MAPAPTAIPPAGIVFDYNPLFDPPPGAVGIRAGRTHTLCAQKLRALWIHLDILPLTFNAVLEYDGPLTHQEIVFWVAADAGCSWADAVDAVYEVIPEIHYGYWKQHVRDAGLDPETFASLT